MLDDLYLFVVAVDAGSLTAAAERLNTTVATVSRRLAGLERTLGFTLLHRSSRGLALTPEGELYYEQCSSRLMALSDTVTDLQKQQSDLSGELRVLVPGNLAARPLASFWEAFVGKYPQIRIRVNANNAFDDLYQLNADIAIRVGNMPDSSLMQRCLGEIKTVLVAAPENDAYMAIDDLENAPAISTDVLPRWELSLGRGKQRAVAVQPRYTSNDLSVVKAMVKSGQGVSLLPYSEVFDDLQSGQLKRILPEWEGPKRHLYLVWTGRHSLSRRAKVFAEELTDFLQSQDWFDQL